LVRLLTDQAGLDKTSQLVGLVDQLSRQIRSLQDSEELPLRIKSFHSVSPGIKARQIFKLSAGFRFTDTFASKYQHPLKLVLQVNCFLVFVIFLPVRIKRKLARRSCCHSQAESSFLYDDVQKVLSSVVQLSSENSLQKQFGLKCTSSLTCLQIDVESFRFNLYIFHERELIHLKNKYSNSSIHICSQCFLLCTAYPTLEVVPQVLETEFVWKPIHATTMRALHFKYPSYSATVRYQTVASSSQFL
jgi:hypothetical protein